VFRDEVAKLKRTKMHLKSVLEINDLGEPKLTIGLDVYRDRKAHSITIS
jgi:hypothetical protein